jgi:glycosyltransferase involved in cell wall biosynthesis
MKLTFFTGINKSSRSGETIYISRILKQLQEKGADTVVYAINFSKINEEVVDELKFKKIKFRYYERDRGFYKEYFKLIINSINDIKNSDYVACRLFYFQPVALLAKLINPKCQVIWFHDGIIEELYFRHPDIKHKIIISFGSHLERVFSRFIDWYLPVSNKMKEYSSKKGYKYKKDCLLLPCVVEIDKFVPSSKIINKNQIVIGYSGSLATWQGFEEGCMFIKFLTDKGYNIKFEVLTQEKEKAIIILDKFCISGGVKTVTHEQVPEEMKKWHFALSPKLGGLITKVSSPLKVAEAMAMGLPLIISKDVGDYSDIVEKNNFGIVVDFTNKESWTNLLEKFDYIIENYGSLNTKIRDYAQKNLSIELIWQVFSKIINSEY